MPMYSLTLERAFSAQHFLIGGDWGEENLLHAHPYRIEFRLEGPTLDPNGYLVDLVEVERLLDKHVAHVRDRTLNDLPAFAGINPSLEHFARIVGQDLVASLKGSHLASVEVRIWESEAASASYRAELR